MRRLVAQHVSFSLGLLLCAILLFFMAGLRAASAGPIYSIQVLGAISGTGYATAINNSGVGVGFITDASGNQTPVSFNGQTVSLGGAGIANAINDNGTIVGSTWANNAWTVREWSNGSTTNVGGLTGSANGINNAGQIVGAYVAPGGQTNAFVWNNGSLVNLGTLNGGSWSSANAINASGQIVGTSMTSRGTFAAFISNGSGMISLCPSCNGSSYANALNSSGTAVGTFVSGGYLNAAEYNNGSAIDLGTLGGSLSAAYGIDDNGDIVGYSLTADNAASHAFLYSNGVMVDLNTLLPSIASGWTITAAYGINDLGDIVGTGTLDGQTYAVALDPEVTAGAFSPADIPLAVPEPTAFILTGGGLLFIGSRLRRRMRPRARL